MCGHEYPFASVTALVYAGVKPKRNGKWTVDIYTDCCFCGPAFSKGETTWQPSSLIAKIDPSHWSNISGQMFRRADSLAAITKRKSEDGEPRT